MNLNNKTSKTKEATFMKKKLTYLITAALLLVCVAGSVYAQSDNHDINIVIPTIRLLGVYDNSGADFSGQTLTLTVANPTNPGDPIADVTDNTLYLRYTVLSSAEQKITAALGTATPAFVDLNVTATPASNGAGDEGSSAGQQTLDVAAVDVVNSIESCWTGVGNTDGANLEYVLDIPGDPASLVTSNTTHTVTYTITDQ